MAPLRRPLIFATRRPPFPLDNGARIRAQRLAAGLSQRFELTLVTFADAPRYDDATWSRDDLERVLPRAAIELVPYGRRAPVGVRRNLLRRQSVDFGALATPTMRQALQALLARSPDSIVHFDDPAMALAGQGIQAALRVASTHNVEYRIMRDLGRAQPWFRRFFLEAEWRKIAAEERRAWRSADIVMACSEIDAATIRAAGAARVEVCPNGTDPSEPEPMQALATGEPLRLLFVGSGDFWPYELGLAWFAGEVMPLLASDGPVVFDVVGTRPKQPVAAPGVTYHGRVADVAPYYRAAHALVIPVFQGSGTRLKALEAGAHRRPVISTRLGMEGLPLRAGEHYLHAEDAAGFRSAVETVRKALSGTGASLEPVLTAARAEAESFFWPRIAADLADLYEAEAEREQRPSQT
jgi:glycosyltransferase involved in cell wall biosynthesis